ncbi:MAG: nitrile hydratase accessory protein [Rhodospirillaceae bacterium]|nr:nitrile hydratase accessory protein [Rhodospirillaceae bacterium]
MPEQLPSQVSAEPAFSEPWHVQVFAITMRLSQSGHFTWTEWTEHFGAVQAAAARDGAPDDGSGYYDAWLVALESLLIKGGLADADALAGLKDAWTEAYLKTAHGEPVELKQAANPV